MKCWFDEKDFVATSKAIRPGAGSTDPWDDPGWPEAIVRAEADNGTLTLKSPYGEARVPAEIEERGVFFCPLREFAQRMSWTFGETRLMLEATPEYINTNHQSFLLQWWQFEVFRDPATAPQTWAPEEPIEEDALDEA